MLKIDDKSSLTDGFNTVPWWLLID